MIDLQITISDIQESFDKKTIFRGNQYFLDNNVLEFKAYQTTDSKTGKRVITLFSKVRGNRLYEQKIVMPTYDDDLLEGECTCPVGYNCKHVVAVFFKLLDEYGTGQQVVNRGILRSADAREWLSKVLTTPSKVQKNKNQENFLIYRLFEYRYNYDRSDIEFYRAKILKNGTLSKGNLLRRENIFNDYKRKEYLNNRDRDVISSISNLINSSSYYYDNSVIFSGEYGALVIKRVIETGRCFYKSNREPLKFIDTKKILSFSWKEGKTKSQLVSNMSENEYLIEKTIPAFCIDTEKNLIYEVESSYSSESLDFLLNAPELPNSDLVPLTQEILTKMPELEFPVPKKFEIENLEVTPKAHLYLYGQKKSDNKIAHMMKLSFLYDTHKIASHTKSSTTIVTQESKTIKIIRDLEQESRYKEVIEELGFEFKSHPQVLAYLSFAKPSMQIAIERWREFTENRVPQLRDEGWEIEIDDNFNYSPPTYSRNNLFRSRLNPIQKHTK